MATERTETLIIGGGQAGLVTAFHLQRAGREFLVVESNERVGDNWRRHYDSLTLFSPRKVDSLPGLDFPGPAMGLPAKDEVADYLERYAEHHGFGVRTGVRVHRVRPQPHGFEVETSDGTITAENVVAATGTYGRPYTPEFASELAPTILQLHSSQYKRPSQLQDGPALVIGAAHSGVDIACELAASRQTILSGRRTGELPIRLDGPVIRFASPVARFVIRKVLSTSTPIGRKAQGKIRGGGGPLIDPRVADVRKAGVEWVEERTESVVDGRPVLASGRVLDVANVIWATGFHHDYDWIEGDVMNADGYPKERRGISETIPGLYFMGVKFQTAFSSMLLTGVDQDARIVTRHLLRRKQYMTV